MFQSRADAGRQLAKALTNYRGLRDFVVLALPRGGVPVAFEIAQKLSATLDILPVRKLGAPGQPELAIGAVADGEPPYVVWNEALIAEIGASQSYCDSVVVVQLNSIAKRRLLYAAAQSSLELQSKTVIIVDDGIATGATMRVAIDAVKARGPGEVWVAVPVAAAQTLKELAPQVDVALCLEVPSKFRAVGCHYADFTQVSDDDVKKMLISHSV